MKKFLLPLFLILFSVSFSYAHLVIQPQRIESTVNPNVPIKGSYSVTNNYDGDVTVEITAIMNGEWSYKGNMDIPVDAWLKINPSKISIRKGETRTVLYTITPTANMQGSVAGQVTFRANPPNSFVHVLMSLPIHIINQGTERIEYSIDSISVNERINRLDIGLKNSGNIIIKPVGTVTIYSGSKKVKSVPVPESFSVFPDSVRKEFYADLPADLKPGKYKAEVAIKLIGYSHLMKPVVRSMQFRVLKDGRIID